MDAAIQRFLASPSFAVAGASHDASKFGARVFRALCDSGRTVFPLNPRAEQIQGHRAYASLADLPAPVEALSIVTPPAVTERVVAEAIVAGVRRIWMQPGAESPAAVETARAAGLEVIAGGPCVLVELNAE